MPFLDAFRHHVNNTSYRRKHSNDDWKMRTPLFTQWYTHEIQIYVRSKTLVSRWAKDSPLVRRNFLLSTISMGSILCVSDRPPWRCVCGAQKIFSSHRIEIMRSKHPRWSCSLMTGGMSTKFLQLLMTWSSLWECCVFIILSSYLYFDVQERDVTSDTHHFRCGSVSISHQSWKIVNRPPRCVNLEVSRGKLIHMKCMW